MAEFIHKVANLWKELLAKDAKVRELQKTLWERPEQTQPQQLELAWKEFHDVEQRFALVESPDLSDTSLPTFSPVLVETLRKILDSEFDLLRQLQSVQLTSSGATSLTDRDETTLETTTPSSSDIQLVVFWPWEETPVARETNTSGLLVTERSSQLKQLKAQLEKVQSDLVRSEDERRRLESRVRELST
ncbi:hypothetical protein R1flu_026406 [Riccia fluitans]|uniref:Uncharacterized protein n=1 Tax=Riccia fluitans TaxID=41844 RepID=A0ABD1XGM1_9MARC